MTSVALYMGTPLRCRRQRRNRYKLPRPENVAYVLIFSRSAIAGGGGKNCFTETRTRCLGLCHLVRPIDGYSRCNRNVDALLTYLPIYLLTYFYLLACLLTYSIEQSP